jgi:glycine dehydrogenase subunit 1
MDENGSAPTAGATRESPYAPHTAEETTAMLAAVGAEDVESLFDVPESVRFNGEFGIEPRSERAVRREVRHTLQRNDDLVEVLGRGEYDHYVPSVVDHLADRGEFLTAYTQYQPEVQQGFLQALFEFQSIVVELTGLGVANCSLYDAATALGEAALLSARVRETDGDRVLVPDSLYDRRRAVLERYLEGPGLGVEAYATEDGQVDPAALSGRLDDAVMVYAETPAPDGPVETNLAAVGDRVADRDALFCVGSDPVALSVLEPPAAAGADVVVGDASVLGLGRSYGTGLGMFAAREAHLRQVPGRLVGATTDREGRRSYTLTLQTREQHIRRERATSNVCTNQAWLALRTAIHAAWLGPDGLVDLARRSVERASDLAARLDDVVGARAPVHDGTPFREFLVATDQSAPAVADDLRERGFAVHVVGDHRLGVCPVGLDDATVDRFVAAFEEVVR